MRPKILSRDCQMLKKWIHIFNIILFKLMGNVCCQTDVNTNVLENEILRIDEYQEA